MIGEYDNAGRGSRVTISPVVPGAQYRFTAWALGSGNRSATPAIRSATTRNASELVRTKIHMFTLLTYYKSFK